jgi:hypothetical protein
MDQPQPTEIEIFRAGTHTAMDGSKVTITAADLAAIAERYDPSKGEAPLVVGHPQTNAPAYGWAKHLRAEGDLLFAQPHQVDDAFADMVRTGRFKKRSASFFRPESPGNPTPGEFYLRHIGFLGAAPPAVAGLRDASFAAGEQFATVEFAAPNVWWVFRSIADLFRRVREDVLARDGVERADQLIPSYTIDSIAEAAREPTPAASFATQPTPEPTMDPSKTADFAARDAALTTREQDIAAREAKLREQEGKAARAEVIEFAAALVKEGRLLPRDQPAIVELLAQLQTAPATLEFAAADGNQVKTGAADALRGFLKALPVQVDFAERSRDDRDGVGGGIDFAAPRATHVNRDKLELDAKALAYMRQHPNTAYLAAVRAVGG